MGDRNFSGNENDLWIRALAGRLNIGQVGVSPRQPQARRVVHGRIRAVYSTTTSEATCSLKGM